PRQREHTRARTGEVDTRHRTVHVHARRGAHGIDRDVLRADHGDAVDVEQRALRRRRAEHEHGGQDAGDDDAPEAAASLVAPHGDAPRPQARVDRGPDRCVGLGDAQPSTSTSGLWPPGAGKPTRRVSARSQQPCTSCTRRRTLPISAYTSSARPPGSAMKKLACLSDTTAVPWRIPRHPALSMSRPAESSAGFVNTEPAFWPPGWCSRRHFTIDAIAASDVATSPSASANSARTTTCDGVIDEWR